MSRFAFRISQIVFLARLWRVLPLTWLACHLVACDQATEPTAPGVPTPGAASATPSEENAPRAYRLESEPFSPNLAHLFDEGRIVVFPEEVAASDGTAEYAFSAVDRYGQVYHFDRNLRWTMLEGNPLPQPLPSGGWDAAWNPDAQSPELLISAPYAGEKKMQLRRRQAGRWLRVPVDSAPDARAGALRAFSPSDRRWHVAGGEGWSWSFSGGQWTAWEDPPGAHAPDMKELHGLLGLPDGDVLVLDVTERLWRRHEARWFDHGAIELEGLKLAAIDTGASRLVLAGQRELGRDWLLSIPLPLRQDSKLPAAEMLVQTAEVRINEDDQGLWQGIGVARVQRNSDGTTETVFQLNFKAPGTPALQVLAEQGPIVYRHDELHMVELPPRLSDLRSDTATFVPALGGILAATHSGSGISASRQNLFPVEAQRLTSETLGAIDLIRVNYRFWLLKDGHLEWLNAPSEINPAIGYPYSHRLVDGRRRALSWIYPEPGLFRYEFHEFHEQKMLWLASPLLTLRALPGIEQDPAAEFHLLDPVVTGDPPQVVLIGWYGTSGRKVEFQEEIANLGKEALTAVPTQGFMARIDALEPNQWEVSPLPIPFTQGARAVVDPRSDAVYVLGGRVAVPYELGPEPLYFMTPNASVWLWNATAWEKLEPRGETPRMKATNNVAFDLVSGRLLSLTPLALYGFDHRQWLTLWQRERGGERWPDEVGLYVHPISQTILGGWYQKSPRFRVWDRQAWAEVEPTILAADANATATLVSAGGALPDQANHLLAAEQPDTFISVDADQLARLRMDVNRDRSQDRLLRAHWLRLVPAEPSEEKRQSR